MVSGFREELTGRVCFPFPSACFINNQECTTMAQALSVQS